MRLVMHMALSQFADTAITRRPGTHILQLCSQAVKNDRCDIQMARVLESTLYSLLP